MNDISASDKCVTVITAFSGSLWLRISANVYNCKEDYILLKEALLRNIPL